MEEIFGPQGLIARAHPEYEYRPGQVQMAEAVLSAFEEKRHLIVEAGTGTGKTLAYLVPAIAMATSRDMRIVISTGTKNLQEQLMEKDIPFLQKALPKKFKVVAMKGRSNYACIHRIKKAETQPLLENLDEVDYFDIVRRWVKRTKTGDRAELHELPENLGFWRDIDARSDICLGQKCPDFDECFITHMRQQANDADIIIVNHHLFFADLSLRGNDYGQALPGYGAVIFDEAHMIEDIAADYFGAQVSNFQIEELLRDTNNLSINKAELTREITQIIARIARFGDQFWISMRTGRGEDGRFTINARDFAVKGETEKLKPTPLGEAYLNLDSSLKRLETTLDAMTDKPPEIDALLRRIRELRLNLKFIVVAADPQFVYWLERRGRGAFLRASPIDVSGMLREQLFDNLNSVVLTSATLASAGNFTFITQRLGLPAEKTDELIAPSNYDYENQSILYLPSSMPDPRSPEWTRAAVREITRLIKIARGRTFVLSTSNQAMNALYQAVSREIDYPCMIQGSASKAALLKNFRETEGAVLFATSSFWQGVDVRGSALSCV
ncbi:MAG: ATP-dependent DNA helicase, partial [Pyrinomonadaceae bacterium]